LILVVIGWKDIFPDKLWTASGLLYIGIPCVALVWMRNDWQGGRDLVLWLLCVVWATDIGAYFFGKSIGGPRLAPVISPNKTWAGLIGGMVSAGATGALLLVWSKAADPVFGAWMGGGTAIVAQGGDLLESSVKRHFGVKDSGAIIPGHGGVLDRVDGILAVAPVLSLIGLFGGLAIWR
jgi:phosphatidate cytidylyltransferase